MKHYTLPIQVLFLILALLPVKSFSQSGKLPLEFIPEAEVLYMENFEQDILNEFPLKWFTNNTGLVKNRDGAEGKWFRMSHSGRYLSPVFNQPLPRNFSLSFDLIMDLNYTGYVFPNFSFSLIENITNDNNGRLFFTEAPQRATLSTLDFTIAPGMEDNSDFGLISYERGGLYFSKEGIKLPALGYAYGKKIKVSLWVQGNRLRLWLDEEKVLDIPAAVPNKLALNRIAFDIPSSIQPDSEIGFYITNIVLAAAIPDLRSKLIQEGKYATTGILFDLNASEIKEISMPLIAEIASILKENPSFNFMIAGHTDSEGSEEFNLKLSQKRAEAVKELLVKKFGISADRLEAKGFGESNAAADNSTEEGRAKNRRVEFIRQ